MEKIMTPEVIEKVGQVEKMIEVYQDYKIISAPAYTVAGDDFKKVNRKMKELTDMRLSMTRPLDDSKSKIMAFFKKPIEILEQIKRNISLCMSAFQSEQQRKARAEEERLRKLAEVEARELERRAGKVKSEEKREQLLQQAEETKNITPVVAVEVPKVQGVATRTNWKYEIINEKLIPRNFLKVDEVKLGQVVRATKGTLQIPGVKIYSEESIGGSR